MKLASKVGSHSVLGYLVTYRVRESDIDLADYGKHLDNLITTGQFNSGDVETLRAERRRPVDVQQTVIKAMESRFDGSKAGVRYMFRADKGASLWGPRHIVRETFGTNGLGKAVPIHKALGRLRLDDLDQRPAFVPEENLTPEESAEASAVVGAFNAEFEAASGSFPSRMLRSRISKLVDGCTPVAYDAEHRFSFVLAEHASTLELIANVLAFVDGDRALACRSQRSDVAVLPLPDLDEYRSAIGEAFLQDVGEALEAVRNTVSSYVASNPDVKRPADLVRTITSINSTFQTIKKFEAGFAKVEASIKEALDEVRDAAQGLLGMTDGAKPRQKSWAQTAENLPFIQSGFGNRLAHTAGVTCLARSDGASVTWSFGQAVSVVQTGLDTEFLHLTFVDAASEVPAYLQNLDARRGLSGWVIKPTIDMPAAWDAIEALTGLKLAA